MRAFAAAYSSESGGWSQIITVQVPFVSVIGNAGKRGTLAGSAVYWLVPGGHVLEFDSVRRNLALISVPTHTTGHLYWQCQLVLTEAKELGLAMVKEVGIELWKRDSANDCGWSMYRSVQLNGCLPPRKSVQEQPSLLGFHEDSNAIFVWIEAGVFMIELESMQSRLLCQGFSRFEIYPFAGFYTRDAVAGAQADEGTPEDASRSMLRSATPTQRMWHYEDPQAFSSGRWKSKLEMRCQLQNRCLTTRAKAHPILGQESNPKWDSMHMIKQIYVYSEWRELYRSSSSSEREK